MSQRECAGFNWPPLSVPAEEPVRSSPWLVSRMGPGVFSALSAIRWAASIMDVPVCAPRARFASGVSGEPRVASVVVGVGQPAIVTTVASPSPE